MAYLVQGRPVKVDLVGKGQLRWRLNAQQTFRDIAVEMSADRMSATKEGYTKVVTNYYLCGMAAHDPHQTSCQCAPGRNR